LSLHWCCVNSVAHAEPLEPEHKMAAFLLRMGGSGTVRTISQLLGMSESSVSRSCDEILMALINPNENMRRQAFVWPLWAPGGLPAAAVGFSRYGILNCIGAIDGTHIRLRTTLSDTKSWINRKSYASMILQVVCTSDMLFTDIVTGWPGSVHDARVFRNSPLFQEADLVVPNGWYIVADGGYALSRWCMVPFRDLGALTPSQRRFNNRQSSTRMVVERAFGQLKGRWRILQNLATQGVVRAAAIIEGCCVLHNFGIRNGPRWEPYADEWQALIHAEDADAAMRDTINASGDATCFFSCFPHMAFVLIEQKQCTSCLVLCCLAAVDAFDDDDEGVSIRAAIAKDLSR
jgi:hypothetical protein